MLRYTVRRVLWLIPIICIVVFILYFLLDHAPGSIVDQMTTGDMTEAEMAQLREQFDLDKSVFYRYVKYMIGLVQGNLGVSQATRTSVWHEFITRFPNTIVLALSGLVIGVVIGVPLGINAAKRPGSIYDNFTTMFAMVGMSMPNFWLGLLLMLLFSYKLKIFPTGGIGGLSGGLLGMVLPAISTSLMMIATTTRQVRSSMLENIRSDYLRTARAKGVSEHDVIYKHALGNAWIPIITSIGGTLTTSMAGSAVIETVFSWPGVGKLTVDAVMRRDVTVVCGCVILTTIIYVVLLLLVDILYAFVDPRIKSQYTSRSKKKKKGRVAV